MIYTTLKNKILIYGEEHAKNALRDRLADKGLHENIKDVDNIKLTNIQVLEVIEQDIPKLFEGAKTDMALKILKGAGGYVKDAGKYALKGLGYTVNHPFKVTGTTALGLGAISQIPVVGKPVADYSVKKTGDVVQGGVKNTVIGVAQGVYDVGANIVGRGSELVTDFYTKTLSPAISKVVTNIPWKKVGLAGVASIVLTSLMGVMYAWKKEKEKDCSKLTGPEKDVCELKLANLTIEKLRMDKSNCSSNANEQNCIDQFDKLINEFTAKKNKILNSKGS